MEIQPGNQPNHPGNQPNHMDMRPFSVGVTLREAREHMGLSVADVANRLKFAPRQIEALEEDNFSRLPEIAFVRGFVRSYAKLLQLDPAPLVAALPQPPAQTESPVLKLDKEVRFPATNSVRKQNFIWLGAGVTVAVALGLFIWMNDGTPKSKVEKLGSPAEVAVPTSVEEESSSAQTPATPATPATPGQVPASPAKPPLVGPPLPPPAKAPQAAKAVQPETGAASSPAATIRMTFDQDAWVEVSDKYGTFLMAQLNLAGTERRISGNPPFTLTIGNASSVHLYYQGKPVDLSPFNRAEVAHLTLE